MYTTKKKRQIRLAEGGDRAVADGTGVGRQERQSIWGWRVVYDVS